MTPASHIAPTPRKAMNKARRTRIFLERNGICMFCGVQIRHGERWLIEHPDALALGGPDEDSELHPAHERCAKPKTKQDMAKIAKRNTAIDKGYAGKKAKRPGFRGWRKFSGEIVWAKER